MKLSLVLLAILSLAACSEKSAQQKVEDGIADVHALTADERQLAENNSKQFFNREFPQMQKDTMGTARGMWLDCKPSDSNFNGLVTCHGMLPKVNGGFDDKAVRYCGYTPKLVGCSDTDTSTK
jgi:hypothetical protein